MKRDKVLNIVILILIIACLIMGGRLLFVNYNNSIKGYNQSVLDCIVETIKGNKTKEDIENIEMDTNIKNYLENFLDDFFYTSEDLLLLDSNINIFENNIDFIRKVNEDYEEEKSDIDKMSFLFLSPEYGFDKLFGILNSVEEVELTSEEKEQLLIFNFCLNYNGRDTDINRDFEIIEDSLYIHPTSLDISNGYDFIYYKGLEYYVVADTLDKKVLSFCRQDDAWQNLSIVQERDRGKTKQFIVSNNVDSFAINASYKWGKIINIEIVY